MYRDKRGNLSVFEDCIKVQFAQDPWPTPLTIIEVNVANLFLFAFVENDILFVVDVNYNLFSYRMDALISKHCPQQE